MGLAASGTEPAPSEPQSLAVRGFASRRARFRNHAASLAVYLLLAFVFLLPGSLSPGSALLGLPGDNFQHAWFLWHFARAVSQWHNPFYTHLLFYPVRVNLAWSTTDSLAGLMALPVSLVAGPVVAYNLSLVLQLALAAFFGRLVCLRVCRNEAASFVGGLVFGFSSFQLAQALGHLSLVTAFPLPLFILALDRIFSAQNPPWKMGVPLGLALLLAAFAHYNYVVLCLLFALFWLAIDLELSLRSERLAFITRVWKPLAAGAVTFLAGFSPLLWMMVGRRADIPLSRGMNHLDTFSADVLGFLIPSWNHILLGHFARRMSLRVFLAGYEGTVYVGVVVLVLAALGFWKGRASGKPWALRALLLVLIFYFLSLGPKLRLLGHPLDIPGPAALFYLLPFAKFMSAPARFDAAVALCLAVLCAFGTEFVLEQTPLRGHRYLSVSLIAVLLICDALTIPFPRSSIANPGEAYTSRSVTNALPGAAPVCQLPPSLQHGTVLAFPLVTSPYCLKSMWMQVSDGGRFDLLDGYLSYAPAYVWKRFWNLRILRSLMAIQGLVRAPIDIASDRKTVPVTIRQLNLSTVVVYDSPQRAAGVNYVESLFGARPQRAGGCTIFSVPRQQTAEPHGAPQTAVAVLKR
jgi:hypothetical protein